MINLKQTPLNFLRVVDDSDRHDFDIRKFKFILMSFPNIFSRKLSMVQFFERDI